MSVSTCHVYEWLCIRFLYQVLALQRTCQLCQITNSIMHASPEASLQAVTCDSGLSADFSVRCARSFIDRLVLSNIVRKRVYSCNMLMSKAAVGIQSVSAVHAAVL